MAEEELAGIAEQRLGQLVAFFETRSVRLTMEATVVGQIVLGMYVVSSGLTHLAYYLVFTSTPVWLYDDLLVEGMAGGLRDGLLGAVALAVGYVLLMRRLERPGRDASDE